MTVGFNGVQYPVPRYYIRRVKKKEGRTIKFKVTRLLPGSVKEEKGYKIIENPEGFYSRRILLNCYDNQKKRMEEWQERFKLEDKDYLEISKLYSDVYAKRISYVFDLWNRYSDKSDLEVSKDYDRVVDQRFIEWNNTSTGHESPLDRNVLEYMKSIAVYKEHLRTSGLFGQRDVLEIMEDYEGIT